jgi:hypothetical protein
MSTAKRLAITTELLAVPGFKILTTKDECRPLLKATNFEGKTLEGLRTIPRSFKKPTKPQ